MDIIKQKLDKESLGIILFSAFMEEFFSEQQPTGPDTFTLYHYNGLSRSNPENKIVYHKGQVVLLESNLKCVSNNNMLTCLQTKWPNIEVEWDNNLQPSLNWERLYHNSVAIYIKLESGGKGLVIVYLKNPCSKELQTAVWRKDRRM